MNLLYVTPRFPYPPIKGDQLIIYHRLRLLGRRHRITLASLVHSQEELEGMTKVREWCDEIIPVVHPKLHCQLRAGVGLLSPAVPLQVAYFHSPRFRAALEELRGRKSFDLVDVFTLRAAPYGLLFPRPRVVDLIDSMQLNMERRAGQERFPKRQLFQEELRRVRAAELAACRDYDAVMVVAERDREVLQAENVSMVQNGVDTEEFRPLPGPRASRSLIFSGNMGYAPNIHAVRWFVRHCFPLVRRKFPQAQLIVAGGNPAPEVVQFGRQPGIRVTGFVDSMPEALNGAAVSIAPMQSGSGIQNKILEAMACELPCVVSTLGLGSIRARVGEEVLVADSPEEFAAAIERLFNTPHLGADGGRKARVFVQRYHSWEANCERVEEVYAAAAAGERPAAAPLAVGV